MTRPSDHRGYHEDDHLFSSIGPASKSHDVMLQQAARLARLGYFVFNVKKQIVEVCSRRHASIFGMTPESFIACDSGLRGEMSMMHPEDIALVRDGYDRLVEGQSIELEYRFFRANGSIGYIREFVSPEWDQSGAVVRGLGSSLDVTELHLLQQRKTQASRLEAVGELTAGVAHDFNNILTAILGNAEIAQTHHPDAEVDVYLSEIISAVERGSSLTRSLLNFTQRAPIQSKLADLNHEVQRAAEIFERTSLKHGPLQLDLEPAALNVIVDPDQLQAMLFNLLINARDAVQFGGKISLCAARLDPAEETRIMREHDLASACYYKIEVSDNGVGIAPGALPRVTEPFFTTKGRAKGSGLGLSMAAGFAKQSRGALEITSTQGEGTKVSVYFPAAQGKKSTAAAPAAVTTSQHNDKRLLLLEDEPDVGLPLGVQLEAAGFEIHWVRSGEDALDKIRKSEFDIAVLDNVLPGTVQGLDVATFLRDQRPDTKIILYSGYLAPDGGPTPADVVLRKPARFEQLMAEIGRVLPYPSSK